MKRWPPGASSSGPAWGASIPRNHSPFCESTGPVVEEGFVAARIRILQGLQAQAQLGNRSHSPMIPCPPRWDWMHQTHHPTKPGLALQETIGVPDTSEYATVKHRWEAMALQGYQDHVREPSNKINTLTARSMSSVSSIEGFREPQDFEDLHMPSIKQSPNADFLVELRDRGEEDKFTERQPGPALETRKMGVSVELLSHNEEINSIESDARSIHEPVDIDGHAAMSTGFEGPALVEHAIYGPHPVPVALADSLALSNCLLPDKPEKSFDNKHGYESERGQPGERSRKSVADHLGSLVECGWVGSEIFGKADSDRHASENLASPIRSDESEAVHRSLSSGQKQRHSDRSSDQACRAESIEEADVAENESYDSADPNPQYTDTPKTKSPFGFNPARSRKLVRTINRPTTPSSERCGSEVASSKVRSPASSMVGPRRTWSFNHPNRLRRGSSKGIELCSFTQCDAAAKNTGDHGSHEPEKGTHEDTVSKASDNAVQPENDRDIGLPAPSVTSQNSRTSSRHKRITSRSTSWFQTSWFMPFRGDKRFFNENPREQSLTSKQQDLRSDQDQHSEDASTVLSIHGPSDGDHAEESMNAMNSAEPDVVSSEKSSQDDDCAVRSLVTHQVKSPGEEKPNQLAQIYEESSPASLPMLESQQHRSPPYSKSSSLRSQRSRSSKSITIPTRRSSKRAPTISSSRASLASATSTEFLLPPGEQSLRTPQRSLFNEQDSATPVSMSKHEASKSSSAPSVTRRGHGCAAESLEQHKTAKSTHRRSRGAGRDIKKIQVIVSFDGGEGLMTEAVAETTLHVS